MSDRTYTAAEVRAIIDRFVDSYNEAAAADPSPLAGMVAQQVARDMAGFREYFTAMDDRS